MFNKKGSLNQSTLNNSGIEALLSESRRLLEESKTKDISMNVPAANFSPEIKEIFENMSGAIQNYRNRAQYEIMKYALANNALHTGLWDMEVVDGDPVNPNNTFIWSNEFRRMLGFSNESDFPNKLNSWSDRLHPEDKERTISAFAKHMTDRSGRTPYNLEYRCKLKNGEYRYFQALGDTMRDEAGRPLRVAGLLLDIDEEKKVEAFTQEVMSHVKDAVGIIDGINRLVGELDSTIDSESNSVEESSAVTAKIVNALKSTSEISKKEQAVINELMEKANQGQESMRVTIQSIEDISKSVGGISQAIQIISSIAANTNLLSMNAAIEAAHAGDAGRGFAVVADEIRRLSESTRQNSINISKTLKSIIDAIGVTTRQSGNTETQITQMSTEISGFAQTMSSLITTFNQLAAESSDVIVVLTKLKEQSATVKSGYAQLLTMTGKLNEVIVELTEVEKKKAALHRLGG